MNKTKYIEAGRFVECYGDWYTEEGTEIGFIGPIKELVYQMPAADVQEVRHGRWVPITEDGIVPAEFLCSICGRKISHSGVKDMVSINYPYCHCGAKMDEEKVMQGDEV